MDSSKVNQLNTTRVLRRIWMSEGTTRVELARELSLVKSTVSRITSLLLEQGIIREVAEKTVTTGAGRRPVLLRVNEQYGTIVGVEIQPDFYHAVAIDLHGHLVHRWSGTLGTSGKSIDTQFLDIIEQILEWLEAAGSTLIGVGVALAGIIDQNSGTIFQSNPLNVLEPVQFLRAVQDSVPAPVVLENDANCGCWGELVSRRTARQRNFLFVLGEFRAGEAERESYWGIAVGLGIVLQGEVYHGSSFSAGEFQSILWQQGNHGQLSISDDEVRRIKDDPEIMERALHEVCAHVAFLINTLNLTGVVFGGEITEYKHLIVPLLEEEVQKNWSYPNHVSYTVDFSPFNELAVAYGAAGMCLESMFSYHKFLPGTPDSPRSRVSVFRDETQPAEL